MIETTFAYLRFAASASMGIPFSQRSLDRLLTSLKATRHEFGASSINSEAAIHEIPLNTKEMQEMQLRRFRKQALRAVREVPYYTELFKNLSIDPAKLSWEDLAAIPLTPKIALREQPDIFVSKKGKPVFCTVTTGTTGNPTKVYFSAYEMNTYITLAALSCMMSGTITEKDVVQLSTSSRATLGNTCFAGACARVGAMVYMGGLIDPSLSLNLLTRIQSIPGKKSRTSVLSVYPSYLGELVETGLRLGYSPQDFGLERIIVGGEVVTAGLKERAIELFGTVVFEEGFGQTETWPCTAMNCPDGHIHFDPNRTLLEVIDVTTGKPTEPGKIGSLVLTPLPPFRETTIVLRYDTGDLVQTLPTPPTCTLKHLPAVSTILGKRALSKAYEQQWITPLQVMTALEADTQVPLPAKCGFWTTEQGVNVEVVVREPTPVLKDRLTQNLLAQNIPLYALHLHTTAETLQHPLPRRGDLKELNFENSPSTRTDTVLPVL